MIEFKLNKKDEAEVYEKIASKVAQEMYSIMITEMKRNGENGTTHYETFKNQIANIVAKQICIDLKQREDFEETIKSSITKAVNKYLGKITQKWFSSREE